MILKGDANSTPDADPYILSSVDRVVAHVPYAGYAASWLSTPFAWVVGGLAAAALLYVVVRPTSLRRESPVRPGRHRVHSGVAAALVAVVVVPGFAATQGTEAALNDTAQARAVPTAATMVRPTSFTCTDSLQGSNRAALLSWPSVDPLYGYRLVFQSEALLGQSRTVNLPAGTLSSYPPAEILSLLQNFTVSLYSRVGEFVSTPALTRRISVTSLGSNGISTCVTRERSHRRRPRRSPPPASHRRRQQRHHRRRLHPAPRLRFPHPRQPRPRSPRPPPRPSPRLRPPHLL